MTCRGVVLIRARQNGVMHAIHAPGRQSIGYWEYRAHMTSKSSSELMTRLRDFESYSAPGGHSHSADEPFVTALVRTLPYD